MTTPATGPSEKAARRNITASRIVELRECYGKPIDCKPMTRREFMAITRMALDSLKLRSVKGGGNG